MFSSLLYGSVVCGTAFRQVATSFQLCDFLPNDFEPSDQIPPVNQ